MSNGVELAIPLKEKINGFMFKTELLSNVTMANLNRYAEMICYDSQTLKLFQATMLNLEGFAIITTWQATSIC